MPRKKPTTLNEESLSGSSDAPEVEAANNPPVGDPPAKPEPVREPAQPNLSDTYKRKTPQPARLGFNLKDDGTMDVAGMQEATREKVRAAISPQVLAELGLTPQEARELISDDEIDSMLATLGKGEAFLFSKLKKLDADIAEKCFTFTPQQTEALRPVLKPLANKYLGGSEFFQKWGKEIQAAMTMLVITKAQLRAAQTLMAQRYGAIAKNAAGAQEPQQPESVLRSHVA